MSSSVALCFEVLKHELGVLGESFIDPSEACNMCTVIYKDRHERYQLRGESQ